MKCFQRGFEAHQPFSPPAHNFPCWRTVAEPLNLKVHRVKVVYSSETFGGGATKGSASLFITRDFRSLQRGKSRVVGLLLVGRADCFPVTPNVGNSLSPLSGLRKSGVGSEGCSFSPLVLVRQGTDVPHTTSLSSLLPRWGPAAQRHEDEPLQPPAGSPSGVPAPTSPRWQEPGQQQRGPGQQLSPVCHAGVLQGRAAALVRRADPRRAEVRGGQREGQAPSRPVWLGPYPSSIMAMATECTTLPKSFPSQRAEQPGELFLAPVLQLQSSEGLASSFCCRFREAD